MDEIKKKIDQRRHFDSEKWTYKYGLVYRENENSLQKIKELLIEFLNRQEFPNVNNFPYKIKISKPGDYYDYENFILSTTPLENHDPINKAYISEKIQMINVSTLVIKIVDNKLVFSTFIDE